MVHLHLDATVAAILDRIIGDVGDRVLIAKFLAYFGVNVI
jgi:hypothetical protein